MTGRVLGLVALPGQAGSFLPGHAPPEVSAATLVDLLAAYEGAFPGCAVEVVRDAAIRLDYGEDGDLVATFTGLVVRETS